MASSWSEFPRRVGAQLTRVLLVLACLFAIVGCHAAKPTSHVAPEFTIDPAPRKLSTEPVPDWLAAKIRIYETFPVQDIPDEIWRLARAGQPAYLFVPGCCDRYEALVDASGTLLCHPSGGYSGHGDGTCPCPADRGTEIALVWVRKGAIWPNTAPRLHAPVPIPGALVGSAVNAGAASAHPWMSCTQ